MQNETGFISINDSMDSDESVGSWESSEIEYLERSKHSARLPLAQPSFSDMVLDMLSKEPVPVWNTSCRSYDGETCSEILQKEIQDFVRFIEPTDEEHNLRRCIVGCVDRIIRKEFHEKSIPKFKVETFGSFETRLYLPNGDIDLSIIFESEPCRSQIQHRIGLIGSSLRKSKEFIKIELVLFARVPIVKAIHRELGIPVDISIQQLNGKQAVERVREFLGNHEALRPLIFVLKMFFGVRGLLDVYSGGISSYSLITMIQCFLNSHMLLSTKQIHEKNNLAVLLIEWFELFGSYFDHRRTSVTMDGFQQKEVILYSKEYAAKNINPQYLSIIDPNDKNNDLARGSKCAAEIIRAIQWASSVLTESHFLIEMNKFMPESILGLLFRVPPNLVNYRKSMLEHGRTINRQVDKEEDERYFKNSSNSNSGSLGTGKQRKKQYSRDRKSSEKQSLR